MRVLLQKVIYQAKLVWFWWGLFWQARSGQAGALIGQVPLYVHVLGPSARWARPLEHVAGFVLFPDCVPAHPGTYPCFSYARVRKSLGEGPWALEACLHDPQADYQVNPLPQRPPNSQREA